MALRQRWRAFVSGFGRKGADELACERGQAKVRLVNSLLVFGYFIVSTYLANHKSGYLHWVVIGAVFIGFSMSMLMLARRTTVSSVARRLIGNVADIGTVTYLMIVAGDIGIPLFILYISITLGNGLRFGVQAMTASSILSLIGLSAVLVLSPAWAPYTVFAAAIMMVLVLLPFSARLMRSITENLPETTDGAESSPIVQLKEPMKISPSDRSESPMPHFDRNRVDELGREQRQAIVRMVNSVFVLAYLAINSYLVDFAVGFPDWLVFLSAFIGLSVLVLVLSLRATKASVVRRFLGNVGDVSAISYVMIVTGVAGIPLFILFLSVTFGNGFRFGLRAMIVSAVLSVVGFSAVVAISPVWWELPVTVSVAVLLSLILLPAYAAHLIDQLSKATKHAEEASAAKSRFLARMSHELRTPLNGVLGTTELLRNSKRLTRDDRSLLDIVRDSVRVSMRQIDNVLDFSKIEAGKLTIEQVRFDLHALLNRAIRLVRAAAIEKNLRLTLRIDPSIPYELIGDPHHLDEVLLNLLSNAVKFTEQGYVSLEARLVRSHDESVLVRFEVHDTGIGIESGAIARIFEAFTQEDGGTTRRYGGTGLGTTITKQLVELMGGKLQVESEKGRGSTFHADIYFPVPPISGDIGAADASFKDLRVLLVSEDVAIGRSMALLVKSSGATINVIPSVGEAVGLLARGLRVGNPIHMVLCDRRCAFTAGGDHYVDDFLSKAALSFTPVFLLCDVSPEEIQLRRWGYAAALSYDVPRKILFSALHSCCSSLNFDSDRVVVQVEPWAWGRSIRTRPRVLVADDNRTNLMILRKILENAGFVVETADNGERALEMLIQGKYKAAVIDMHMPDVDGVAVIKQFRVMRAGARTPIIMLTANATIEAKLESAEAGADAYLSKPATASEVVSTIMKLIEDTDVHELRRGSGDLYYEVTDGSVLDVAVITELDRLYGDPREINRLLNTFEHEGTRLLRELETAASAKNHVAFCNLVHALKGSGANVGAARLTRICMEIEGRSQLDFRRHGEQIIGELETAFAQAVSALREFTVTGESGPTRGADHH